MEKKWNVCVRAEDVEFRILKTGEGASQYDRAWKAAHVSFSTSCAKSEYVMTVEFLYGKRIDIMLAKEMSRFQVQEVFGRVTIVADKKQSTFCIKNVQKDHARAINFYLTKVVQEQQKVESSTKTSVEEDVKSKRFQASLLLSPLQKQKLRQPSGRMCYSESKRKPSCITDLNGKRQRSSSSPVRLCLEDEDEPQKADQRKSNGNSKKFQDFRKAQSDVRHSRLHSDDALGDAKENTSPTTLERIRNGLNKTSFYGDKTTDSSFIQEMKNYQIVHSSPSPRKRTPSKSHLDRLQSTSRHTTCSAVVRALLQDNKKCGEKADLGIRKLPDTTCSDDENPSKQSPLVDRVNLILPTRKGGFQNLGNTCYMNSTLQSLFGLLPFQKDILQLGETIKSLLHADSVLMALINLMQRKASSTPEKSTLLKAVKLAISSNAKQFHGFAQQDAHEFVRLCLDLIKEEIAKLNKKIQSNFDEEMIESSLQDQFVCPVTTNFCFTVKNEIACSNCNAVTSKEEELYDLPVELRQKGRGRETESLQKLVNLTFAEEKVEHACDDCQHTQAVVRKIITKLPRIMMIYLKRYSYNFAVDQSEKLRQRVAIPRYVTFRNHCNNEVQYSSTGERYFTHEPVVVNLAADFENDQITDKELENYFDIEDKFGEMASVVRISSSPLSTRNPADDNNNNNVPGGANIAQGSSGEYSNESPDTAMQQAVQASVMDYYEKSRSDLPDAKKLESMSEDDQIMLAIRLSMLDENQQKKSDKSTSEASESSPSFDDISPLQSGTELCPPKNTPKMFETPERDGFNSCAGSVGSSGSFDISGPKLPASRAPASRQDKPPVLADSCPSLSSIQMLVERFPTVRHEQSEAASIFNTGSSGLDICPPHRRTSVTPRKTDTIKQETPPSDLSEEIDDEEGNELFKNESRGHLPHSYHIVSIVSHKGGSSKFGHYVSDVLTDYASNQWQCYDDDYVENFSEDCVLLGRQTSCYLLFYVHK